MKDEDIEHALRSLAATDSEVEPRYLLDKATLERLADIQSKACGLKNAPREKTQEASSGVFTSLPIYSKRLLQILVPTAAVIVALLAVRPFLRSGEQWANLSPDQFRGTPTFSGPFADFNESVGVRSDFPARKVVLRLAGGRLLSGSLTQDSSLNEPKRSDRQFYRVDVSGSLKDGTVVEASGSLMAVDPILAQTPAAPVNVEDVAEATLVLEVFAEGRSLGKLERTRRR
jgi:hypothetical protein